MMLKYISFFIFVSTISCAPLKGFDDFFADEIQHIVSNLSKQDIQEISQTLQEHNMNNEEKEKKIMLFAEKHNITKEFQVAHDRVVNLMRGQNEDVMNFFKQVPKVFEEMLRIENQYEDIAEMQSHLLDLYIKYPRAFEIIQIVLSKVQTLPKSAIFQEIVISEEQKKKFQGKF